MAKNRSILWEIVRLRHWTADDGRIRLHDWNEMVERIDYEHRNVLALVPEEDLLTIVTGSDEEEPILYHGGWIETSALKNFGTLAYSIGLSLRVPAKGKLLLIEGKR